MYFERKFLNPLSTSIALELIRSTLNFKNTEHITVYFLECTFKEFLAQEFGEREKAVLDLKTSNFELKFSDSLVSEFHVFTIDTEALNIKELLNSNIVSRKFSVLNIIITLGKPPFRTSFLQTFVSRKTFLTPGPTKTLKWA